MDKIPMRPAAYVRISKDDKDQRKGVVRQREDCLEWAVQRGWPMPVVYEDNDLSASVDIGRPMYEKLWVALESGERDGLVVYDADRFTRKPVENELFIDLVQAKGIALGNVLGDVDLSTANGRMIFRIKGAVARQEAERIAERTQRAFLQAAQEGKPHMTSTRSYGYETDGRTVIPAEARIVREIVSRLLAGEGVNTIKEDLIRRQVPTVTGARWHGSTVRGIVLGHKIAGLRFYQRRLLIEGDWPAIISRGEWEAVQALMLSKKRGVGWNTRKHLLSGFCTCSRCGNRMPVRNGSYICAKDIGGCGRMRRNQEKVEQLVTKLFLRYLESMTYASDPPTGGIELEHKRLLLEEKLKATQAAYDSDQMELVDYLNSMRDTRTKIRDIDNESAKLARQAAERDIDPIKTWETGNLSQRRALLATAIQFVVIKPQGKGYRFDPANIEIVWT